MKYILLALLVASAYTMSPSVTLNQQYDDMLVNNMGNKILMLESEAEITTTKPLILPLAKVQILKHCAENMEKSDFENSLTIIKKVIKTAINGESHNSYHALLTTFDYRNEVARTYELTVSRNAKSVVAVLAKKFHEIEKKDKWSFYYETYESVLGLPFTNVERGPKFDSDVSFEMIGYIKQYLLRGAHQLRGTQPNVLRGLTDWISSATGAVTQITGAYKEIVSAFKTTKTETIKELIKGEGFSKFSQKSRFLRSLGVPNAKFDDYMKAYRVLTGLKNSKYQEEIDAICSIAQWLEENSWSVNDFVFDENDGGVVNSIITLTRANLMEGVTHFITVNLQGAFALAPDILVITKHKSIAGGIYENTKDVRKKIPRSISEDEVKAVQALMLLNSMKIMADAFNVPFKFPTDDPNKL